MITKILDIFKLLRIKFSPLNDTDDDIRRKTTQLFRKRQILFRYLLQSQFSQITRIAGNVLRIEWKDSVYPKLFLFLNVTLTLIYLDQRCFKIVSSKYLPIIANTSFLNSRVWQKFPSAKYFCSRGDRWKSQSQRLKLKWNLMNTPDAVTNGILIIQ